MRFFPFLLVLFSAMADQGLAGAEMRWPSAAPEDCPFEPSESVTGMVFTGRHARYTEADGWYPSWASDGNLYSSFSDGKVSETLSISLSGWVPGKPSHSLTAQAVVRGDDPMNLAFEPLGVTLSDCGPYYARYASAMLVHDGVWYYGNYFVHPFVRVQHEGNIYAGPWLGPFVGFRWSTDFGKTWTQTPCTAEKPLFGESALHGEPVKLGALNFVDFGKNMEHSPDGKAYLVGHGASDGQDRRFGFNSWITGDEAYLIRVAPSIENMNDRSKYEFFAGHDADGKAVWSREFGEIKPLAAWRDHMGWTMITYNAALRKYLMCVTDGVITTEKFHTYILESDAVTGPWRMVAYLKDFGEQAYFVNFPTKFISGDGRTLWMCYGANYSDGWNKVNFKALPEGSGYGMCLQEVRLETK